MKIERVLKVVVNKNPNLSTCGWGPKLIDTFLNAGMSADGKVFMFTYLIGDNIHAITCGQYPCEYMTNTSSVRFISI